MITFIENGDRIATENFETGEIYTITFTNGNYKTMCCIGVGSDFVMFQYKLPNALFCLTLGTAETVSSIELGGGGSGTMNYNELENKPQINGIVLIGNKSTADLGLVSQSDLDDYATNASVAAGLATKQNAIDSTHKLSADLVDDTNATNKFATVAELEQIQTNKNNILIEDITSTYTIETGYTLSTYSKVYKQGKHVFGLLSIKKDTGTIPTSQTTIATASNKPSVSYVTGCFCGTSEWNISTTGYVFINPTTGAILARDTADPTTNTTFNIQVDYVIS